MTTCTVDNTSGLRYSLATSPTHLAVSEEATLTLTITNPTDQPIACSGFTLTFPLELPTHDTTVLTSHPETINAAADSGWHITSPEHGVYAAAPPAATTDLAPGKRITLTLNRVTASADPGAATLFLSDGLHPTSQDPTPLRVVVWPSGPIVDDFHPTSLNVQRGEQVTLKWNRIKESAITYALYYYPHTDGQLPIGRDGGPEPIPDEDLRGTYDVNSQRYDVDYTTKDKDGMTNPTVIFALNAIYQGDVKSYVTYVQTTRADGEFYNVGVSGATTVLNRTAHPLRDSSTVYRASTDGFLVGWVKESDSMSAQGTATTGQEYVTNELQIQVNAPDATDCSYFHLVSGERESHNSNVTIPVAAGSEIIFEGPTDDRVCELLWHPLGTDIGTGLDGEQEGT
ncbi:hypothetical protein AB0H07_13230 [Streptomyces sp. NPDC021354]|uniref:hypothetical protein n=1 Tax=Streptomyces sp. NPDC021354 TaxID=3154793 RepID=UPI0033D394ED